MPTRILFSPPESGGHTSRVLLMKWARFAD